MIQRIQTVYLALALLSLVLMFAFKISVFSNETNEWFFSIYGLQPANSAADGVIWFPPFILNVVLIILLLVIITMFKNRKMQLMLGRLSYLLILGYFVLLYFWTDGLADVLTTDGKAAYSVGIYFPMAALAFVFLANRAIKKDEELVKSLDRLR